MLEIPWAALDATCDGFEAYVEGFDREHNPHPPGSEESLAWVTGWEEAERSHA